MRRILPECAHAPSRPGSRAATAHGRLVRTHGAGKALAGGNRDKFFVATKFGNVVDAQGNWGVRGDPEHVR